MGWILLMISNYFHDLSVAILASNILAIYYIGRFLDAHRADRAMIRELFLKLSRVTYIAFGYIIVGGAVRAYYFMDFEWHPSAGRGQITALFIKHIILAAITAVGIVTHIRYYRKYVVGR